MSSLKITDAETVVASSHENPARQPLSRIEIMGTVGSQMSAGDVKPPVITARISSVNRTIAAIR